MNGRQLVNTVAKRTKYRQMDVLAIIRDVTSLIKETLAKGESVSIHKFGTFLPMKRKERIMPTRCAGEKRFIPSGVRVKFRAHSALRQVVNGGAAEMDDGTEDEMEDDMED